MRRKHQPHHQTKGATGETSTSSENKEAGMQTGLSEEEKEAHYKQEYDNTVFKVLEKGIMQAPEAGWGMWIRSLLKPFPRENRSKRSEKPDFLNLDKLEALKTEHLTTSGSVPYDLEEAYCPCGRRIPRDWLKKTVDEMK